MEFQRFAKEFLGFIPAPTQLALGLRVTVSAVLALFVAQALWLPMPLWSVLSRRIRNQEGSNIGEESGSCRGPHDHAADRALR